MHTICVRRIQFCTLAKRCTILSSRNSLARCFSTKLRSVRITSYKGLRELYKYEFSAVMSKECYKNVFYPSNEPKEINKEVSDGVENISINQIKNDNTKQENKEIDIHEKILNSHQHLVKCNFSFEDIKQNNTKIVVVTSFPEYTYSDIK